MLNQVIIENQKPLAEVSVPMNAPTVHPQLGKPDKR